MKNYRYTKIIRKKYWLCALLTIMLGVQVANAAQKKDLNPSKSIVDRWGEELAFLRKDLIYRNEQNNDLMDSIARDNAIDEEFMEEMEIQEGKRQKEYNRRRRRELREKELSVTLLDTHDVDSFISPTFAALIVGSIVVTGAIIAGSISAGVVGIGIGAGGLYKKLNNKD